MFWHVLMSVTASILLVQLLPPASLWPVREGGGAWWPGSGPGDSPGISSSHAHHLLSSPSSVHDPPGELGAGADCGTHTSTFGTSLGKNAGKWHFYVFMYLKIIILRNTKINASLLFQRIFFPTLFPPSWDGEYDISPRLECSLSLSGARALYLII